MAACSRKPLPRRWARRSASSKRSPRTRGSMTTETEADEMLAQLPEGPRDFAVLGGRLLLGVVMFAFGWEKWVTKGLSATAVGLRNLGVPFPVLSAAFAGTVELLGGALLILGALTAASTEQPATYPPTRYRLILSAATRTRHQRSWTRRARGAAWRQDDLEPAGNRCPRSNLSQTAVHAADCAPTLAEPPLAACLGAPDRRLGHGSLRPSRTGRDHLVCLRRHIPAPANPENWFTSATPRGFDPTLTSSRSLVLRPTGRSHGREPHRTPHLPRPLGPQLMMVIPMVATRQ